MTPAKASERGVYFLDGLKRIAKDHSLVGDASGIRLYFSLEFVKDRKTKEPAKEETGFMTTECLRESLICEHSGYYFNHFNLIPSLLMKRKEIDQALDILDRVIARAEEKFGYR